MRIAEQENCIANHSEDCCVTPIQGRGLNMLPACSHATVQELLTLIKDDPEDLRSLLLLYIAYMTLGENPQGVPRKHLIPPSAFESQCERPRFFDVASRYGLAKVGHEGDYITADFDGDGDIDVMNSSMGKTDQIRHLVNDGNDNFTERTAEAGLIGLTQDRKARRRGRVRKVRAGARVTLETAVRVGRQSAGWRESTACDRLAPERWSSSAEHEPAACAEHHWAPNPRWMACMLEYAGRALRVASPRPAHPH